MLSSGVVDMNDKAGSRHNGLVLPVMGCPGRFIQRPGPFGEVAYCLKGVMNDS
jgi:hypothetical protein